MKNIFVPNLDYSCYIVLDQNTIRAYHTMPYNPGYNGNIQVEYTDYYINSHYIEKEGYQNFGYNSQLPTCLTKSILTTDYYYRNDFDSIAIIFILLFFVIFYIPFKVVIRLFRRFQ